MNFFWHTIVLRVTFFNHFFHNSRIEKTDTDNILLQILYVYSSYCKHLTFFIYLIKNNFCFIICSLIISGVHRLLVFIIKQADKDFHFHNVFFNFLLMKCYILLLFQFLNHSDALKESAFDDSIINNSESVFSVKFGCNCSAFNFNF